MSIWLCLVECFWRKLNILWFKSRITLKGKGNESFWLKSNDNFINWFFSSLKSCVGHQAIYLLKCFSAPCLLMPQVMERKLTCKEVTFICFTCTCTFHVHKLICSIILQIFSLTHTRLVNTSHDHREYSPVFETAHVASKDLKDNKHNSLHLWWTYDLIFVLRHNLFLEAHSWSCLLLGTDNVCRQIS